MGRRERERRERIEAGEEAPFRNINPVARWAIKVASRKGVVDELSKGSVDDQTGRLDELVGTGTLSERKLKESIMRKAPREMDKGIKKFLKQGKEITVDNLLAELRSEGKFLRMCNRVGISYEWFETLARERMEVHGL